MTSAFMVAFEAAATVAFLAAVPMFAGDSSQPARP